MKRKKARSGLGKSINESILVGNVLVREMESNGRDKPLPRLDMGKGEKRRPSCVNCSRWEIF